MPTVPAVNEPSQQLAPLRPAQADPGAYAQPGQNIQNLGRGIGAAASDAIDIQLRIQERENVDAVFRAETALKQAETQFHQEVRELRGENAKELSKRATEFWGKAAREAGGSLGNTPQRRAFERIVAERSNASLDFVSQHEARERVVAAENAAEASVVASIESAIETPALVDQNIAAIRRSYETIGAVHGHSREVIDRKIADATTKAHAGVIKSMLEQNPGGARAYYNKHQKAILPSARESIETALRSGGLKEFSQRKSAELVAKYGDDFEAALADAYANIKDPDRQDATVARLKTRYAEFKTFDADRKKQALEAAHELAEQQKIGAVDDLPSDLYEALGADGRDSVRSYLKARVDAILEPPKHDDPEKLYTAQQLIETGEIHDERQLAIYDPYLTDSGRKTLRTMIAKQNDVSTSAMLAEFEARVGKTRANFIQTPALVEQWDAFQRFVFARVKGPARPQDLQDMADDFFLKMYKPGSGIGGFFEARTTLGQAEVEGLEGYVAAEIPSAHKAAIDRSVELLGSAGAAVPKSDEERGAYYVQTYLPATRHLQRMGIAATGEAVTAYLVLKNNKREISPETIGMVVERLNQ